MDSSDFADASDGNDRKRPMDNSPDSDEKKEKIPRVESESSVEPNSSSESYSESDEKFNERAYLEDKLEDVENNKGDIPALLYAAKYTDVDVCRKLVDDGADVNETDENGNDVYHCAAMNKNSCDVDLIYFFAEKKAIKRRLNNDNVDAVNLAIESGKFMILSHINGARTVKAKTDLNLAVEEQNLLSVKMDNSDYADASEGNDRKRPKDDSPESDEVEKKIPRVVIDSSSESHSETDEEFDERASLEDRLEYVEKNRGDIPALLYAAKYADVDVCQKLVDDGADVNETDENGNDVYHCAAMNKNSC
ncbi:uncharacterized protein LOC135943784 [Cloeon dipterum]|uniref:uncharacterized protein LOC135943784 n=1 Tax=Cloeon dipterum TaxID=197152 RepID=UPI00321FDD6C